MAARPTRTKTVQKPGAGGPVAAAPASSKAAALPTIVAIGASAGGLEAFTRLLEALPPELDMALVLIQHLQPGHPSLLSKLLQAHSSLPVAEATEGQIPKPNCVYVMPAGVEMELKRGKLRLEPRDRGSSRPSLPIDRFMRSLAEEHASTAIGVVLSGTASDGTQGLMAIKNAGGICFAQTEASAEYAAMPRQAVASGCVDFVLPPAGIAQELQRIATHPYFRDSAAAQAQPPAPNNARAMRRILDALRHQTGVDFSLYRGSTVGRRLARRMALHGQHSLDEYAGYVQEHPEEIRPLYEDLLIPATRFFRDPKVFEYLKAKVLLPLLKQRREGSRQLRLWSVGCATGEEAYTLAIIGLEALAAVGDSAAALQVFGTDLSPTVIARARAGRYGPDIAQDISAVRLQRYFTQAERGFRVAKMLRDVCIFAQHNIVRDAPFSHLDVICCRNVMIYMEPELQRRIFPVLHYALNPHGTLVLGSAESASAAPELFKPLGHGAPQRKLKLLCRQPATPTPFFELPAVQRFRERPFNLATLPRARAGNLDEARREADRLVLDEYAPAGAIVDANLDVIEFRGRTSPFLEQSPGAASLNLTRMARGNLGAYVRDAVQRARKTGASVHRAALSPGLGDQGAGSAAELDLHVIPLAAKPQAGDLAARARPLFLVLFQPTLVSADGPATGRAGSAAARRELDRLRRSLTESQQLIRALTEEYQGARQEQQAASEEIASANEELQSSNEELETSKEELQSANEEITTINDELRHANADLHQANADLQNLISLADNAVMLLDRELRIRRYSPAAQEIFNLIPADTGRKITDIRSRVGAHDIDSLAAQAFASGKMQRRDLEDPSGSWLELRVYPSYGPDKQLDGLVLALADITWLKHQASTIATAVAQSTHNPLALLDQRMRRIYANHAFLTLPGMTGEDGAVTPGLAAAVEQLKAGTPEATFSLSRNGREHQGRVRRVPGSNPDQWLVLVALD